MNKRFYDMYKIIASNEVEVFKGSVTTGLQSMEPVVSGYGTPYVYATASKAVALYFLASRSTRASSFTLALGTSPDNQLHICERKKDAFFNTEKPITGSVYVFAGNNFSHKDGMWELEVVSEQIEVPIREERVDDVRQELLDMADNGALSIYLWPNRPSCIPDDDSDLIKMGLGIDRKYGDGAAIQLLEEFHPNLIDRFLKAKKE
jgi:hypothetical protein